MKVSMKGGISLAILTISRQMGSLGNEAAEALSRRLGWELITRDELMSLFFCQIAKPHDLHMLSESAKFYLSQCQDECSYLEYLQKSLRQYVQDRSVILVGFGSQLIFASDRNAVHVRIFAPQSVRIARVKKKYHLSDQSAEKILSTADQKHKRYVSTLYGADLSDPVLYNMILNTAELSTDECVSAIVGLIREREVLLKMENQAAKDEIIINAANSPDFKNPAEIEFAKILDMYQIEWKYEPKTFPIEWDAEGNVKLAFSPDFYLPQFDTYIELTTMNQRYVTTKNRKAKKLRELYPGTNIKIVYKKDFQSLIERFNLSRG